MKRHYKMQAEVWIYPGVKAAWHFLTLPKKQSVEIKKRFGMIAGGWGSLPIKANIGKTSWKTSIFPDKKRGTYLLPIKADVRKKENISAGDKIKFYLEIII